MWAGGPAPPPAPRPGPAFSCLQGCPRGHRPSAHTPGLVREGKPRQDAPAALPLCSCRPGLRRPHRCPWPAHLAPRAELAPLGRGTVPALPSGRGHPPAWFVSSGAIPRHKRTSKWTRVACHAPRVQLSPLVPGHLHPHRTHRSSPAPALGATCPPAVPAGSSPVGSSDRCVSCLVSLTGTGSGLRPSFPHPFIPSVTIDSFGHLC